VIALVAQEVLAAPATGITRVAIDGVDGAGKTTFADRLAEVLAPCGRQVIRATVDAFHRPRAERYARGSESPEGFFLDSYDYGALARCLLDPLAPGGSRRFRRAVFDWRTDRPVDAPEEVADEDAILLLDGIFLHRDELAGRWDYSVFLDVPFEVSAARNAARGGRQSDRYVDGQRLYLAACDPAARATRVIDNSGSAP
jgi:uridine kinase